MSSKNTLFVRLLQRIGYRQVQEVHSDNLDVLKYLPATGRIVVEKDLTNL